MSCDDALVDRDVVAGRADEVLPLGPVVRRVGAAGEHDQDQDDQAGTAQPAQPGRGRAALGELDLVDVVVGVAVGAETWRESAAAFSAGLTGIARVRPVRRRSAAAPTTSGAVEGASPFSEVDDVADDRR